MISTLDRFRGCLLGGAVGDALGGPIEFNSLDSIRRKHGARVDLLDLPQAAFTDDTQMTLFTAEGLIRASVRGRAKGIDPDVPGIVHHAYLRWLYTQGVRWERAGGSLTDGPDGPDGWLVTNKVLHRREAPGNTCLSALQSGRMGTATERLNNSKGCGGVMRVAPVGLFSDDPAMAFEVGCELAAITHSHPSGYFSAGALAAMVSHLTAGASMGDAVRAGRALLDGRSGAEETAEALDAAVLLAGRGIPEPEDLEKLGGGWVGEEALAIAVACGLTAEDVEQALSAAVLHSGDSDSTGAICGNLLGAYLGIDAIPEAWVSALDGGGVVDAVARDLHTEHFEPPSQAGEVTPEWRDRYPGW